MPNEIILKFSGNLAPNDQITARTLAHSLQFLQRAVDKVVIYETRGNLRKYDSLSSRQYTDADFFVNQFEPGCIQIPLINQTAEYISSRLRGILAEPFNLAATQREHLFVPIANQLELANNRAVHLNPEENKQENLLENPNVERRYSNVAILKDLNQLISPMRSSRVEDQDSISLRISDQNLTSDYQFSRVISHNFNAIVTSKSLGPETVYRGFLKGLEASNSNEFPYSGKFISSITNCEMKMLISTERAALALSPFNLSPIELIFWGAPMTTYGAFDEFRGDIVFIEFLR